MKKITNLIVMLTGAIILLSSCGHLSNITVEKRHFNKGYYVDFGSSKSKAGVADAPKEKKQEVTELASIEQSASESTSMESVLDKNGLDQLKNKTSQNSKSVAASHKTTTVKTEDKASELLVLNKASTKISHVKSDKVLKHTVVKSQGHKGDNNKLVWTIIIILLILLIAGAFVPFLGGLIWLLLVIVLILLLLKLLGII